VAEQIVGGFAGVRPLISVDSRSTKNLSRDHKVEIDSQSGLISILGGKWTTYRAMAEDTIDAFQRSLQRPVTECRTRNQELAGSAGYTTAYFEELAREYGVSRETARHLVGKLGTYAAGVCALAASDPELVEPVVDGYPAIGAEIVYSIQSDMAMSIEDILARRIGLQFYSWKLAEQAAPTVAKYLAREYGWSDERRQHAVDEYVGKPRRMSETAGLGN
jgi:glycerol-3-phosphate dehydrogenase